MKKEIPIFFSFNNDYVVPAAVAFHTLLYHAKTDVFYKMFVLHSDISEYNKDLLFDIVNKHKNAILEFIDVKGFLRQEWERGSFENLEINLRKFTPDAIIRCFAARFFQQFDKIIYSDVDVVFMDDISELWNLDLEGKYIGAVKNAFIKNDPNELSHLSKENYEKLKDTYFSGGIWVMNLEKIRRDNLEEKMIEIVNDDNIAKKWNDQDVMNIACDNKVKYISLRYISYPYLMDVISKEGFQSHYAQEELLESLYKPKILHYAAWKPWKHRETKKADIWWDIFTELGLRKTRIFKIFDYNKLSLKNKMRYKVWKYFDSILKEKGIV